MADPKFWRRAAAKFRRLQPRPPQRGEVHHASHNRLCAWWMPDGWSDGKLYHFFNDGDDSEANKNVQRLFMIAAESAEVELGHEGGDAAVFAWLDRLRLDGLYTAPAANGSLIIHRVCDASAEHCLKCETDVKTGARGLKQDAKPRHQSSARKIETFWNARQAEFEKYADRYGKLSARWRAPFRRWVPSWGSRSEGRTIPQECIEVLNAIARKALTELAESHPAREAEPWESWLDFMRERGWSFRVTGNTACTEKEWGAGVKDGKPLADVRREQKYTLGDEGIKVYRRTEDGNLRRLSARELHGQSSENLSKYYHWLEDGVIDRVFYSSATLCQDLAARATELIAQQARNGIQALTSPVPSNSSAAESPAGKTAKKLGRPQTIPDQRKARAQTIKNSGGTNKDVAIELYQTKYPSSQQVKNVGAILRHYNKSKQSSTAKRRFARGAKSPV